MDSEQPGPSTDLYLGIVRRRGLWILVCFLLFAAASYGYSKQKTKKYTATAVLSFNSNTLDQQIAGLSGGGSATNLLAQQTSNRELVSLGDTAAKTAAVLGGGLTPQQVGSTLSIGSVGETGDVDVASTSTSSTQAAEIANTYATQFVKAQQSANRRFFRSALVLVNKQLAELPLDQRFVSAGLDLQERAHTLRLLADLGYNNAQLAQHALVPSAPSSPKVKRNTILGAILGLLVGIALVLALERFDGRVRGPDDLEALYDLPMVGVVPRSSALSGSTALPPAEAEAFSLIRAHLRFFNVDRDVRTVVVASAAPGEGKTTIARHLAEAAARSGSRVLLLEADLRFPTLSKELSIKPGPGVADVLVGTATLGSATQSVELRPAVGEGVVGRRLDALVAGAILPPNPGELLESRAMRSLLEQAKALYDLVVIDTPPLTSVSDAFPLLTKVDGVVIVGWVGRSRRDAAERLQRVLAGSGAPLLGVIANGSKAGAPDPYGGDIKPPPAAPPTGQGAATHELASASRS